MSREIGPDMRLHRIYRRQEFTLGERLADAIARFGGSWTFITLFAMGIVTWIGINEFRKLGVHFDPYPFILLNLILSCLAAIQAPIIMMSQNRQEEKDRLRAESDYKINVKSEKEIRQLQEKLDLLITQHQVLFDRLGASGIPPVAGPDFGEKR